MTTSDVTPHDGPPAADVDAALRALQARLTESKPDSLYCRPLPRAQIATLVQILLHYLALRERQAE